MGVFKLSRRASFLVKLFVYASFYALTIWVIVAPFFFEPTSGNNFPWLRSVVIFFASVLLAKYFFYMFLSPWHDVWLWIRYGRKLIDCKYHPKVSVVIPAWNEQVGILTTIKSLLNSTYKKHDAGNERHFDNISLGNKIVKHTYILPKVKKTVRNTS